MEVLRPIYIPIKIIIMENKILFGLSLMAAMSFSACQKNEMVNEGDNALNARLQVEASVSGMAARTTSSLGDGHTSFADGVIMVEHGRLLLKTGLHSRALLSSALIIRM